MKGNNNYAFENSINNVSQIFGNYLVFMHNAHTYPSHIPYTAYMERWNR